VVERSKLGFAVTEASVAIERLKLIKVPDLYSSSVHRFVPYGQPAIMGVEA